MLLMIVMAVISVVDYQYVYLNCITFFNHGWEMMKNYKSSKINYCFNIKVLIPL